MEGIHITSEDIYPKIEKIEPNKVYNIIKKRVLNTKYGAKTVLVDDKNKSYWVPSNMMKVLILHPQLKKFKLTTKDLKTYNSNKGNEYQAPAFEIDA